jgi:DNA-binding MarR family transcriptional regulator
MRTNGKTTGAFEPKGVRLPCACANLRKAARVVTQFYDSVLRPSGMRLNQFTLLQALQIRPGMSQKQLAEVLGLDSTTLTRTLAPLRRNRWLRLDKGDDRRELRLYLSAAGLREYRRVRPYWQSAQKRLRQALGENNWNELMNTPVRTAGIVPER